MNEKKNFFAHGPRISRKSLIVQLRVVNEELGIVKRQDLQD